MTNWNSLKLPRRENSKRVPAPPSLEQILKLDLVGFPTLLLLDRTEFQNFTSVISLDYLIFCRLTKFHINAVNLHFMNNEISISFN